MFIDNLERDMDDISTALNTYMVLVLNEDPFDIIRNDIRSSFFFDLDEYPYIDYESRIKSISKALSVFEDYEHYEKCFDIIEYIEDINLK